MDEDERGGKQVLVEGSSKKDADSLTGRTCTNKRVQITGAANAYVAESYVSDRGRASTESPIPGPVNLVPGDYAVVEIRSAGAVSLEGVAVARTTLKEFVRVHGRTTGVNLASDAQTPRHTPREGHAVLTPSVGFERTLKLGCQHGAV